MKRDIDLIRQILFQVEEHPYASLEMQTIFKGKDEKERERISYHVTLMDEAGLIVAKAIGNDLVVPVRLTWQGHEFLDAVRDNTRWDKVKNILKRAGVLVFELVKPIALDIARDQITNLIHQAG
jgi:predicted transcriptional regulator